MTATTQKTIWYREPFVWVLIVIPLTAVVMGFLILYYSITSEDGLVDDDYYQDGLQINQVLDRDRAARAYGLNAMLQLHYDGGDVAMQLNPGKLSPLPRQIQAKWMYATRSGLDQRTQLAAGGHGLYHGPLPKLAPGHWYVQLEAGNWRLLGSLYVPRDSTIHLPESLQSADVDIRVH